MCFRRKSCLDDYETVDRLEKKSVPINLKLRGEFKICIIDDEKKDIKLEALIKLGYKNVDLDTESRKLEDYKKYDIVLCDIHGVANDYSQKEEGLALAKHIKKLYPCTEVFIFTGQNVQNYGDPKDIKVLQKPMSSSALSEVFDGCIKNLLDPAYLWNSLYKYLIENNVKPKEIVLIEDNFVKSYKDGAVFNTNFINNDEIKNTLDYVARFIGIAVAAFSKEYVAS